MAIYHTAAKGHRGPWGVLLGGDSLLRLKFHSSPLYADTQKSENGDLAKEQTKGKEEGEPCSGY